MALTAGWVRDKASPHFPQTSEGVEVMTGACVSMSFIKSLVILSSSSTSLMFSGTPPPGTATGPGGEGVDEGGVFIGWLKEEGGDTIGLGWEGGTDEGGFMFAFT